jgi:MerR family transcriptional regulator, mercuric resistance operon regulatory protein
MNETLQIGELAKRVSVSVDTIRYYERCKLLPVAPRTAGGYRLFTPDAIERVLFIKQAQELGFSLDEIGVLLTNDGISDCRRVHDLLQVKLSELDERMKSMLGFRRNLLHYLDECEVELKKHGDTAECPVVVEIAHAEHG